MLIILSIRGIEDLYKLAAVDHVGVLRKFYKLISYKIRANMQELFYQLKFALLFILRIMRMKLGRIHVI